MAGNSPKPLNSSEWDSLIDDYNHGGSSTLLRHTGGAPLIDICLSSLLRKDFPYQLKLPILTLLEHHSIDDDSPPSISSLHRLVDVLRSVIQSPTDPLSFKDQFLVSTTAVLVNDGDASSDSPLISLIELLLTIVNRPNHGVDRQTRGVACECLRQLELAFPCLLSEIMPHLWSLCQSERTHVSQSYVLLLCTALLNVVRFKPSDTSVMSISTATIPLIPFNVPGFVIDGVSGDFVWKEKEMCYKELRRVVAFLFEFPHNLTPFGLVEFMVSIIPIAEELELQASLLKVQFSGLLYTFDPMLCHAFLGMYLKFCDSFLGQEVEVARRLLLLSKESQHNLVFRLLGFHWLLGFFCLIAGRDEGRRCILDMSLRFYPTVFDSLAIKALKLDTLAFCSILHRSPDDTNGVKDTMMQGVKLFNDGLVSVSAFKWLPPWSTETAVAFRTFHKFLIGALPHSTAAPSNCAFTESDIFNTLQKMLVDSTSEYRGLVPVVVICIDRLMGCQKHCWLGEHLLETLNKHLLPKLKKDYSLGFYFPIFERICGNYKVSPSGLIELLMTFTRFLIEKHGPDAGLRSWQHGSKILDICRTMLIHHRSSTLFTGLSNLLAFICLYFPDLEIRDNARFYLRMLICIPGKRLKLILNMGETLPGISSGTHSSSFFSLQSHESLPDLSRSGGATSYIHLERIKSLLVKQSWSLSLPNLGNNPEKPGFFEGIRNIEPVDEEDTEINTSVVVITEKEMLHQQKEPLRVMDAKVSEILEVLRKHFSCIPDYRNMPGLKIKISCHLRFDAEPFSRLFGIDTAPNVFDGVDKLPAIYATVLKFTSSAPYGSIPSFHIPFLLGSLPKRSSSQNSLAIVPLENGYDDEENFKAPVCVELEPMEPMPGLVNVIIQTNADNGQIIQGQLQSISVGIEDMFLKAILPDDVTGDDVISYNVDLFNALWEACESSSSTGREAFVLRGGKGVAAINGTQSVKLLEVPMSSLIQAVELHLSTFVVCVIGETLVDMVRDQGVIKDVLWKYSSSDSDSIDATDAVVSSERRPLYLNYFGSEDEGERQLVQVPTSRKDVGCFHILIFLPPRFHLLFQMEVRGTSTLVRIRTDHWPCLAYVDDYLEALFLN